MLISHSCEFKVWDLEHLSLVALWEACQTPPYLLNCVSQREHYGYFELGDRLQETAVHIYVDVLCAF